MSEVDTQNKTKTAERLTESERKAARILGKSIWSQNYKNQNPNATGEDRKAAWTEVKKEHVQFGRKVLRQLQRHGYTIEGGKA